MVPKARAPQRDPCSIHRSPQEPLRGKLRPGKVEPLSVGAVAQVPIKVAFVNRGRVCGRGEGFAEDVGAGGGETGEEELRGGEGYLAWW